MPTNNLPTATVWKSNAEKRDGYDFRAPSGQLCRVRPVDLQNLVFEGVIDDVDAVTRVVMSDIMKKQSNGRTRKTEEQQVREGLQFIASDEGRTAIQLMDKILPHAIVAPTVLPLPKAGEERDPDAIYIDDVDVNDRAAIFAEVMDGVEKAAQFRE